MMVVPLPAVVLDLLIALNITGALLILLAACSCTSPLDFSVFPSLLLVMTLFRLALNVSATRLVLLDGYAGKVIDAFGHFVVGGSLVVGLVDLPDPDRHPVRRHHQRCRPRRRGRRPLHPRRDARQADGDRRRPQRRPHRRGRGPPAPRRGRRRGRLLRRDGRCLEVRQGRRDRRHRHHADQPDRRLRDRHRARRACRSARRSRPTACSPSATAWSRRSRRCCSRSRPASSSPASATDGDLGTDLLAPVRRSTSSRCGSPAAPRSRCA